MPGSTLRGWLCAAPGPRGIMEKGELLYHSTSILHTMPPRCRERGLAQLPHDPAIPDSASEMTVLPEPPTGWPTFGPEAFPAQLWPARAYTVPASEQQARRREPHTKCTGWRAPELA